MIHWKNKTIVGLVGLVGLVGWNQGSSMISPNLAIDIYWHFMSIHVGLVPWMRPALPFAQDLSTDV